VHRSRSRRQWDEGHFEGDLADYETIEVEKGVAGLVTSFSRGAADLRPRSSRRPGSGQAPAVSVVLAARSGTLEVVSWRKKSKPVSKPLLVIALAAHLAAVTLTWRDISVRSADRIRGTKRAWRIASAVNTVGSIAYWLVGRRD
jgi:hypothetical protein